MSSEPEVDSTQYSVLSTQYGGELPDSPELADRAHHWRSAYVHIPFCGRRCPYCDFAVVASDEAGGLDLERYVDALVTEIGMESDPSEVDAVNFGGGTPTRLYPDDLARIIGALDARFAIADGAEVSIEANPEDWTPALARDLRRIGFNRVSLGIQSFDPVVLEALGRVHSPGDAVEAFAAARSADFSSISIDVIYGTPEETAETSSKYDLDVFAMSSEREPIPDIIRADFAGDVQANQASPILTEEGDVAQA